MYINVYLVCTKLDPPTNPKLLGLDWIILFDNLSLSIGNHALFISYAWLHIIYSKSVGMLHDNRTVDVVTSEVSYQT